MKVGDYAYRVWAGYNDDQEPCLYRLRIERCSDKQVTLEDSPSKDWRDNTQTAFGYHKRFMPGQIVTTPEQAWQSFRAEQAEAAATFERKAKAAANNVIWADVELGKLKEG